MKKYQIKKFQTHLNKQLFKTGLVIFIKYLIIKEDEVRILSFVGLCISKKNKYNTILLKNVIKKETINLLIYLHSPLIVGLKIIKKYKKKYRLNKLYYK